nr:aminoglycoside phosphotransferase family protein [Nocardioides perillae]
MPAGFAAYAARGPAFDDFLAALPGVVDGLVEEWRLTVDLPAGAEPAHGYCALVVPVRTAGGAPAVLKVGFPHEEAEQEHLALRHWDGRGAVRLLRADPHRHALLLERLHREDLGDLWDVEACEVVAGLYGALHVPAPASVRRLATYAEGWAAGLRALPRDAPLPRRLVEQAASLAADLAAAPVDGGDRLLHGDLHYANVLAASRAPWLAIDPKPLAGDPHSEVAPLLWNRWEELLGAHRSVRDGIRLRFHTVVDAAGLEEERARDWVVVRALTNALGRLQDEPGAVRQTPTDAYLTQCVTLAKAVQG